MQNKGALFQNRLLSALVIIAISVVVLTGYRLSSEKTTIAKSITTPIDMEAIDSSNCIVCHTNESVIASMAVISDASDHAAEGG